MEKLVKYYGKSVSPHRTVHKWFFGFRCGRTSKNDAEHLSNGFTCTSVNPANFCVVMLPVDETWIHLYIPETKEQSKMWIGPYKRVPNKANSVTSAGKVIVETNDYFEEFNKTYLSEGIKFFEYRWNGCIELKGMMLKNKLKFC